MQCPECSRDELDEIPSSRGTWLTCPTCGFRSFTKRQPTEGDKEAASVAQILAVKIAKAWIRKELARGLSQQALVQNLIQHGWPEGIAKRLLDEVASGKGLDRETNNSHASQDESRAEGKAVHAEKRSGVASVLWWGGGLGAFLIAFAVAFIWTLAGDAPWEENEAQEPAPAAPAAPPDVPRLTAQEAIGLVANNCQDGSISGLIGRDATASYAGDGKWNVQFEVASGVSRWTVDESTNAVIPLGVNIVEVRCRSQ